MAIKKKDKNKEVKNVPEEITEVEQVEEVTTENNTTSNEEPFATNMDRFNQAISIISNKFGLDNSYIVTGFTDRGKEIKVSLDNGDYSMVVTIKNSLKQGIPLIED